MDGKARYIPQEIVLNILGKLPPVSLLRFRCVSKNWHSCVSKNWSSWITKGRKFIFKSGSDPSSIHSIDQTTGQVEDIGDIPWETNDIEIYGSCHGLLLIGYHDDLYLWNPSIEGCNQKKLFSYENLGKPGREGFSNVGGLCYDSLEDEYKIVMYFRGKYASLGSPRNRTWTQVRFPYNPISVTSGPVFNDRLHWLASNDKYDAKPNLVLYFETSIYEFMKLPMPDPLREGEREVIGGLGVLDGCLCITRLEGGDTVVLRMKEYGVKESWTILFRIEGVVGFRGIVPLFSVGNQTSLVLCKGRKHSRDYIIIYDTFVELYTDVTSADYIGNGVVYEETLVEPVGYGWEELDSRGEASYVEIFRSKSKFTRTVKREDSGCWRTVECVLEESEQD